MLVAVVVAHPSADSYCHHLASRAVTGLLAAGHDVELLDLYDDGFRVAMSAEERDAYHGEAPIRDPLVARYAEVVQRAGALVFVYPTWWSGQPAMLKGWIDRVWVAGVAWEMRPGAARISPGLRNIRRIVGVTTHGSSKFVNALEGESGKRTMSRVMRAMCARRTRTTWCALYGVDRCDESARMRFLDRVEKTTAKLR